MSFMPLHSWLHNLCSALAPRRRRRRHGLRRSATQRPYLEVLEDRLTPSFVAPVSYVIDGTPEAVITGDFNGDGRLDLATANAYSSINGSLSVLLGNGDGTFRPAVSSATGANPLSLAVGDFNDDGKLDLVTADLDGGASLLMGNGDGTFQAPVSIASGSSPQSVAVGDFNGDGNMDFAVTSNVYGVMGSDYYGNPIYGYEGYANVLLGQGDGSFTEPLVTDLGEGFHTSAVAADFNGDGLSDFATINQDHGTLSVALSNGSGYLWLAGDYYAGYDGAYASTATAGDVNGDGHTDLVTGNYSSVGVLLGDGTGGFGVVQNYAAGVFPASVVLADMNHDGHADIATANYDDGTVSVLIGRGNGAFASPSRYAVGTDPMALAAGDFNADEFPDLAVANGNVSVMLNTGDWPSLQVGGFPSMTTAGEAHSLTVTAVDTSGNPSASYTGTIHFTSTDRQADLPADYTFTAADQGTHTFTVTLKTADTQGISVGDSAGAVGDETGITVNAAAASTMTVSFPSATTAGYSNYLAVVLRDAYGNVASGYRGTVHFTSSDAKAVLPANYTFTAADAGAHYYFSATLKTAGTQSITVTDTTAGSLTGTRSGITVYAAQASQFIVLAPSNVTAGVPFSLTVTVEDAYGNVVTGYTGTIHFSSTDSRATLPANYTFTTTDNGVHTFIGLVLQKTGNQTITITDVHSFGLSKSVIVQVSTKKR